ncbi:MAG: acyl carrier protein [Bacteroidales bacterium]|nr:acyl carrier protein [Bacteroidales bacterium]
MERKEVLDRVQEVFRDVLDDDEIVLTDQTTADDVDDWDSLSHIQLIVAVEKAFHVKFTSKEILSWKNVGELVDSILTRTA